MEKTKPTPGPWEFKTTPGSDHEYCTVYVENGKAIARHVEPANAQFIATAPELLRILKQVVGTMDAHHKVLCENTKFLMAEGLAVEMNEAKSIIKQAEGE